MPSSNLDIFKIGVGPSSSHTLGPMLAALRFLEGLRPHLKEVTHLSVTLYGSLSLTGRGHLTDKAVLWGLTGLTPETLTPALQKSIIEEIAAHHVLKLAGTQEIEFLPSRDLTFSKDFLKEHENALTLCACNSAGEILFKETYFSVGGGYVRTAADFAKVSTDDGFDERVSIENTRKALLICEDDGLNLAQLSLFYEKQFRPEEEIRAYLSRIWSVMQNVYARGVSPREDYLPGPLHLKRRARHLKEHIASEGNDPFMAMDAVTMYAIAVSAENAAGGQVVTAPTNGACAVIPAVMLYLKNFTEGFDEDKAVDFLLTACLIGSFYRNNASISGAEAGCQAEIGSASSMAAAAMATVMGGDAHQACCAAEVAMEHHLGLTCDPVAGLVQIPCIERNAFGAIKAITAARMALARTTRPRVSLDEVIKTMYLTGRDLNVKYRETSLGGLAVTVSED